MANDESTKVEGQELLEGTINSKAWLAYQLKLAGLSLREIADRLQFTSGGAVAKAIKDEMMRDAKGIEPEERESLLDLEVARLDYAQSKIWYLVEAGDPKGVDMLIKIVTLRTRLQGLDQVDSTSGVQTVLVIGDTEDEYVNKLKLVAGEG